MKKTPKKKFSRSGSSINFILSSPLKSSASGTLNMKLSLPRPENPFPLGEDTPGPGFYDITTEERQPLVKDTISHSVERFPVLNPDPFCTFMDPPDLKDGKKISIGKRPIEKISFERPSPGPGEYEMGSVMAPQPEKGHRIAEKYKVNYDNGIPGPGQYSIEDNRKIQGFSFSPSFIPEKKTKEPAKSTPISPRNSGIIVPRVLIYGNITIKTRIFKDPEDTVVYSRKKPEIKQIIDEIMEAVLKEKPEEPLKFICDYFGGPQQQIDFGQIIDSPSKKKLNRTSRILGVDTSILYE